PSSKATPSFPHAPFFKRSPAITYESSGSGRARSEFPNASKRDTLVMFSRCIPLSGWNRFAIPFESHGLTEQCFFHTLWTMANTFGQLFRITTWGESHGG